MPITNTFLPGRMPPLMCPQNGTICKRRGEKREFTGCLLEKSQALGPEDLTHQKARKMHQKGMIKAETLSTLIYQSWEVHVRLNWRTQGVV